VLIALAAAWAALAGATFALGPAYSSASERVVEARPDGTVPPPVVRERRSSGLAVNGARVLPAVLLPALMAAAPLLVRRESARPAAAAAAALLLFRDAD